MRGFDPAQDGVQIRVVPGEFAPFGPVQKLAKGTLGMVHLYVELVGMCQQGLLHLGGPGQVPQFQLHHLLGQQRIDLAVHLLDLFCRLMKLVVGFFYGLEEGLQLGEAFLGMFAAFPVIPFAEGAPGGVQLRTELMDVLIVHRVGPLHPGDPIVVVAVWSAHRKAAFEACRWLMEELKSRVPLWKREILADDTTRWVEKNTAGY